MTTNKVSLNLGNKSFYKTATVIQTGVEQINLETQWTDHIQSLVDFGNKMFEKFFAQARDGCK
jgi:hypothetical protein